MKKENNIKMQELVVAVLLSAKDEVVSLQVIYRKVKGHIGMKYNEYKNENSYKASIRGTLYATKKNVSNIKRVSSGHYMLCDPFK